MPSGETEEGGKRSDRKRSGRERPGTGKEDTMKQNKAYLTAKRVFDIVCSLLGMAVTSIFWLVAVIGIEVSDPGPVFYMANRVGKDDKVFRMFKFRSMRQGKADETVFRGDEDRIFPFGKFIRATKIDELPQLLNIFLGHMSIVGPRPASVDQVKIVRAGKYAVTSTVQAGLTGPSALYDYIYGDTVEDAADYERLVLPTRLELDAFYVTKMGVWYDLKMIWYTVVCVLASVFRKEPKKILRELTESVRVPAPAETATPATTAETAKQAAEQEAAPVTAAE